LEWVEVVVPADTSIWNFRLRDTSHLVGELDSVLREWGSKGPHDSEDEECLVDHLDVVNSVLLFKTLHEFLLLLLVPEVLVESLDQSGKGLNASHVAS